MTDDKKANPWKLTPRECDAMAAVIEHGCNKAAASSLGLSRKTIECLVRTARLKMMEQGKRLSRIQAAVLWDRWTRAKA